MSVACRDGDCTSMELMRWCEVECRAPRHLLHKRERPCLVLQWRPVGVGKGKSRLPPLRVPRIGWTAAASSKHSLSFRRPHLYTPCHLQPSVSAYTFIHTIRASAAARHVYEPEQTEDQDEDGDCKKDARRHCNLVPADNIHRAITTSPPD